MEDTFTLTAEVTEYAFQEIEAPLPEPGETAPISDLPIPDEFVMGPIEIAAEESEPDYYLYWYGEGNTAYWLSDQRIDDWGYHTGYKSGDALYAKFGVLGPYMDMDIAMGYGGIRPTEHVYNLESHIQNDVVPLA